MWVNAPLAEMQSPKVWHMVGRRVKKDYVLVPEFGRTVTYAKPLCNRIRGNYMAVNGSNPF